MKEREEHAYSSSIAGKRKLGAICHFPTAFPPFCWRSMTFEWVFPPSRWRWGEEEEGFLWGSGGCRRALFPFEYYSILPRGCGTRFRRHGIL